MKIAAFGCLHGMLDEMYQAVERYETQNNAHIEFVIVCGDCQTVRHSDDLLCLAVPNKYKKMGDFYEYYSGKKTIPKLTIFIGGNHEASNYLMTLPYGGWVCENFYYLGYAGVIRYKGLRIAGVSGIYNYHSCHKGRYERMPLDDSTIRSVYHTRKLDIFRLQLLSKNADEKDPVDIFLSHDWPVRIYDHGNKEQLMRFKPVFRNDINSRNGLGNPLTEPLIGQLKPKRWFAAHLHCRFYAKVNHNDPKNRCTEFLSLNKIENKRNFMEVFDFTPTREYDESDNDLYYDVEWLSILRKTIGLENDSKDSVYCPRIEDSSASQYMASEEDIRETSEMMIKTGGLKVKRNFRMTEPVIYNRPNGIQPSLDHNRMRFYPNFQTEDLCSRILIVKSEPGNNLKRPKQESDIQFKTEAEGSTKKVKHEFDGDVKVEHRE